MATASPPVRASVSPRSRPAMLLIALAILTFLVVVPVNRASAQEPPADPAAAAAAPAEPELALTPTEQAMLDRINEVRAEYGLYPFTYNAHLEQSARRHVNDMMSNNRRSHTGSDGTSPRQRITAAGYAGSQMNEAIGWGYSLDRMLNFWLNSPVHRRMVLSSAYTEIGVAHLNPSDRNFGNWWVLNFGTP